MISIILSHDGSVSRTRQHLKRGLCLALKFLPQILGHEKVMRIALIGEEVFSMRAQRSVEMVLKLDHNQQIYKHVGSTRSNRVSKVYLTLKECGSSHGSVGCVRVYMLSRWCCFKTCIL